MKFWILMIVAAVIGIGTGLARTWVAEWSLGAEIFRPVQAKQPDVKLASQVEKDTDADAPQVEVVNGATYDFGTMLRYATKEHTFVIKNVGNKPLTLKLLRTTCKCTLSEVEDNELMPGETTNIKLEWSTKNVGDSPEFGQMAEIKTNDPRNDLLQLNIRGTIVDAVRLRPDELVVHGVSGNEDSTTSFRIFSFTEEPLKIEDWELLESNSKEHFNLEFTPLPEEELKREKGAREGYLATLTIKSGLPLGPILQTIRMNMVQEERQVVDVPLRLTIASDLVVSGSSRFEMRTSLLTLGDLDRAQGAKEKLFVFVKGPYRHETELSVGKVDPAEQLQVEIGEGKPINDGKTIKYELELTIPPGAAAVDRMGNGSTKFGRIILESTHPKTKNVVIYVRFALK